MGAGENLHLIERFTHMSPDLLRYQITVEDDTVWMQPWTMELAGARIDEAAGRQGYLN